MTNPLIQLQVTQYLELQTVNSITYFVLCLEKNQTLVLRLLHIFVHKVKKQVFIFFERFVSYNKPTMIKQDRITQIFFSNGNHCPCGIKGNVRNKKDRYNIANHNTLLITKFNGIFLQLKSNANLISIKQKMHTNLKTNIANEKCNINAVQFLSCKLSSYKQFRQFA